VIISSNNDDRSNTKTLVAKQAVVLSTGSRATIPKVKGLTEAQPWTNRGATDAKIAPSSLAIMGDGAVACEMAHAWWSLGTKVTIISKHDRILNKYEPFVGERLMEVFKHRGISVKRECQGSRAPQP
jgi:pyruvate/2-oxoglutarate dehydrogenase complex dihydrolipoamide dehydrogenase (E3) component